MPVDGSQHFGQLAAVNVGALGGDFFAEVVRLLLEAELGFDVVGKEVGGFPVLVADFFDDGPAHRVMVLITEGDRLGAVGKELLLAHEVQEDGNSFEPLAQGGHEFSLMAKVAAAGGGEIQGDREGDEDRNQADIPGGQQGGACGDGSGGGVGMP